MKSWMTSVSHSVFPGDLWSQATFFSPTSQWKYPAWMAKCLYIRTKKKVTYASGLLLWPLAAQNKIWFLEIKCLYRYFSSLTPRWRTWRCLTDILDPRILREVNSLPTHITKVWEARNTIHHSLTHPSVHPYSLSLTHLSIHFVFFHLSILWSILTLIFFHSLNIDQILVCFKNYWSLNIW